MFRIERSALLVSVGLALAILAAYANHFQNGFHFDDTHTITGNLFIRDLRNAPRFFTDPALFSTMPDHQTYRPIVSVSLALDYRLGHGLKPFYFHLSTLFWFAVQVILMFFLFRRIMDMAAPHPSNTWPAALAAAFYGLHPANAETVNYIIQRGDLYCTLGVVASLLLFIRYPRQRKYGWYLLPALAAMLSKPPALIYPLILLAYVLLFEQTGNRNRWVALWRGVAPSLLVCAAAAILISRMTPPTFNAGAASNWQYRITQPYVALYYFKSFFLPTELSADTDWGYVHGVFSTEAVAGYVFLAALLYAAYRTSRARETRPIAFGILWFLLALVPTSLMPLAEVMNDHRMFFAFPGLALAAAWSVRLAVGWNRAWVRAAVAASLVVLAAQGAGVHQRNRVWRTDESLWRDVTEKSPKNGRGLMNYGLIFMARGDYATALSYFDRALPLTPDYWALETNHAIADGAIRRDAEAERHFQRAIALAPEIAESHYFYARWLYQTGRQAEAAAQLETALRKNRLSFDARDLLMQVYARQGRWEALDRLAEETEQLAPSDEIARRFIASRADRTFEPAAARTEAARQPTAEGMLELSHQYYSAGKFTDCVAAAKKAVELKPDFAEAYNNLAAGYNSMQMWDEGIRAAMEAVRLKPDYQLAKNNLLWAMSQKHQKAAK